MRVDGQLFFSFPGWPDLLSNSRTSLAGPPTVMSKGNNAFAKFLTNDDSSSSHQQVSPDVLNRPKLPTTQLILTTKCPFPSLPMPLNLIISV